MALYGFMASILGYLAMVPFVSLLLKRRTPSLRQDAPTLTDSLPLRRVSAGRPVPLPAHLPVTNHVPGRLACASSSLCICLVGWQADVGPLPLAALLVGALACSAAAQCDCVAGIIPWECCLAALVAGALFAATTYGVSELLLSLGFALTCIGILAICKLLAMRLGRPDPIGAGDLRLLPALFAFCGVRGSLCGAFSCSLLMCLAALIALLARRRCVGTARAAPQGATGMALPLAPGLCVWLVAGLGA